MLHFFLHCPLCGPDLICISLPIIFCIIEYMRNKETLNLDFHNASFTNPDDAYASILKHGFLNRESLISDSNRFKMLRIEQIAISIAIQCFQNI